AGISGTAVENGPFDGEIGRLGEDEEIAWLRRPGVLEVAAHGAFLLRASGANLPGMGVTGGFPELAARHRSKSPPRVSYTSGRRARGRPRSSPSFRCDRRPSVSAAALGPP